MKLRIKSFGIAREIVGGRELVLQPGRTTVGDLRNLLVEMHPELRDLKSLFIAVNLTYANDATELKEGDEVAIIPPVSGG